MSRSAIFLDRDNTIIQNDGDLGDPQAVVLVDDALAALGRLHQAGWPLIVVTNQGGVARGCYGQEDVRAVHERIQKLLGPIPILDWLWCPWHPQGTVPKWTREHPWRKPQPGMLLEAASRHALDLSTSWLIGDQPRDIEAAKAAGCRSVLLSTNDDFVEADAIASTLTEAVSHILQMHANP